MFIKTCACCGQSTADGVLPDNCPANELREQLARAEAELRSLADQPEPPGVITVASEPTDEEVEVLARKLWEPTEIRLYRERPSDEHLAYYWREMGDGWRRSWFAAAREAWKLGARAIPSSQGGAR